MGAFAAAVGALRAGERNAIVFYMFVGTTRVGTDRVIGYRVPM